MSKSDDKTIFSDVVPGSTYYNEIRFLYDNGYIDKNNSVFGADNPITLGGGCYYHVPCTGI